MSNKKARKKQTNIDDFSAWRQKQSLETLPKSKLGDAIQYTINQWDHLKNYILDGRLEFDNNRSERSIKPFVMERKAWLFVTHLRALNRVRFSIVSLSAKENELKPYEYMKYLFVLFCFPMISYS